MLDMKFIRTNPDAVAEALKNAMQISLDKFLEWTNREGIYSGS